MSIVPATRQLEISQTSIECLVFWIIQACLVLLMASCSQPSPTPIVVQETRVVELPVTVEVTRLVEVIKTVRVPATVEVTRIEKVLITQAPDLTPMPTSTPVPHRDHTGTYTITWGDYGGCVLKVLHRTTREPFDELSFELSCNRGAPSFNSGYAMDTILTADNMAVFVSQYGKCSIVFEFGETGVNVTQIGKAFDCGFGHGVYANGVYQLQDDVPPTLGCMRMDNPCGSNP